MILTGRRKEKSHRNRKINRKTYFGEVKFHVVRYVKNKCVVTSWRSETETYTESG